MGLRKFWPDLQISVKILFWGNFASRCLKFFTKSWSQILEPGLTMSQIYHSTLADFV